MTNNPRRRWRNGGIEYKPPKGENSNGRSFWNAIEKYGWDDFEHIILEQGLTYERAMEVEKSYIELFDSTNKKNGYNISEGGNGGRVYKVHPRGMMGKQQTEKQIESHKKWASQKENNCMTNGKVIWGVTHPHPRGMKGKAHSEEYKERLRRRTGEKATFRKKVKAILPDGKVMTFPTVKECAKHFEVHYQSPVIRRLLKTGEPYKFHPNIRSRREHFKSLEGLRLEYVSEDTEVTS